MKKSRLIQINLFLLVFLLISISGIAQRKISGIVQDAKTNSPMEGATITVKGSKANDISEPGGKFEITVPNGRLTLHISFVGYQPQTITLKRERFLYYSYIHFDF